MNFKFKAEIPDAEKRKNVVYENRKSYPDRIAIICEKEPNSKLKDINNSKILALNDMTVKELSKLIRSRLELSNDLNLLLLASDKYSLSDDLSMKEVYDKYKDPLDEFLYIAYTDELVTEENEIVLSVPDLKAYDLIQTKGRDELKNIKERNPEKIIIFCKKHPCSKMKELQFPIYLLTNNNSFYEFKSLLRKHLEIDDYTPLFLLNQDITITGEDLLLIELYDKNQNPKDGILYITYTSGLMTEEILNKPITDTAKTLTKTDSTQIREKHPDKIPIICVKDPKSLLKDIDKTKYLVPYDLNVCKFNFIIRKQLEMTKESALFLLVAGKYSITGDTSIAEIYQKYKNPEDGFLYITYTSEVTWG